MKRTLLSLTDIYSSSLSHKQFKSKLFQALCIVFILITLTNNSKVSAQNISVNATGAVPDSSAMLDVSSSTKGFLMPRVSLTSTTDVSTIPHPALSLLVFNLNASMTDGAIGFWYWNGTRWIQAFGVNGATGNTGATGAKGDNGVAGAIGNTGVNGASGNTGFTGSTGATGLIGPTGADGSATSWSKTGNIGTVDATNFIGTIDPVPFNVRVFNQPAGRIDHSTASAYWGYQSGNVPNNQGSNNVGIGTFSMNSNTSGQINTAIGNYSLNSNTTGIRNTANGYYAMQANVDGTDNTAVGAFSLAANTNGSGNTATGIYASGSNTTGAQNTAIGDYALKDNTAGNYNTSIGYAAGYNIQGNSNTFVGYYATPAGSANLTNATAIGAGAQVSASNCLVLGNGANVGIGLSAPTHKLDVNGTFNVNGTATCTSGAWLSSDQLFKTGIDSIANALSIINQLKPHLFFFDTNNPYGLNFSSQKQYGLVAQEVQQILPELIATSHKGATFDTAGVQLTPAVSYLTLNYNAFIAILMKGMQEQQQKITNQDAVINALQQQLNTLSNQVQQLQGQH